MIDAFWEDGWRSAQQNRSEITHFFGQRAKNLRGIKGPERGHAFDKGYLDLPNACEIEFGLCCGAGVLEDDFVLAAACDFMGEVFKLFCECCA